MKYQVMALTLWIMSFAAQIVGADIPNTGRAVLLVGGCIVWGMGEIVELLKKISDRGTK